MDETPPKPLSATATFWLVFLALWAFTISAALLVGLWWFVTRLVMLPT
jgi:hypothetical protein